MTANKNNLDFLDQFEVGGTFFELIEFSLKRTLPSGESIVGIYGVNVAKVREVVHMPKINPLASRIRGIAGIFELRGVPIPAIDLAHILGDPVPNASCDQQIVVTEFSGKRAGFIVANTHRIRRVNWQKVLPPSADIGSCMSGMILIEKNEFLFILDLEKILADLEASSKISSSISVDSVSISKANEPSANLNAIAPEDHSAPGILFVDDSKLVLNNVTRILRQQGYRVLTAGNGVEGLDKLNKIATQQNMSFGPLHCIITDVEMPLMDGLTMVKKIRENKTFDGLPILLHTSLSGEVTQTAGQAVGANGYIVKNDVQNLLEMVDKILNQSSIAVGAQY